MAGVVVVVVRDGVVRDTLGSSRTLHEDDQAGEPAGRHDEQRLIKGGVW